jgi:hypothetical protein
MWETSKKFFEEQSAIANFLQIAGATIAISLAAWRGASWVQKRRRVGRQGTVSAWLNGRNHGPVTAHSLRVAVVDDRLMITLWTPYGGSGIPSRTSDT